MLSIAPIAGWPADALRHFYGATPKKASSDIKVGVIDTGIGPHADLNVKGGVNTVQGEARGDYEDNGIGHGTHVAGIIAGSGTTSTGVAPGVTLRSYRVIRSRPDRDDELCHRQGLDLRPGRRV